MLYIIIIDLISVSHGKLFAAGGALLRGSGMRSACTRIFTIGPWRPVTPQGLNEKCKPWAESLPEQEMASSHHGTFVLSLFVWVSRLPVGSDWALGMEACVFTWFSLPPPPSVLFYR